MTINKRKLRAVIRRIVEKGSFRSMPLRNLYIDIHRIEFDFSEEKAFSDRKLKEDQLRKQIFLEVMSEQYRLIDLELKSELVDKGSLEEEKSAEELLFEFENMFEDE